MAETRQEERAGSESVGELVGETIDRAIGRTREELSEGAEELRSDVVEALPAAAAFAGAGLLAIAGVSALTLSLAKALLERPASAALIGLGLLSGATLLAVFGIGSIPERPLGRVREHVRREAEELAGG